MFRQPHKRAISPIVATALLLIVTVLAITGFQTWYTGYQSSTLGDVEGKTQTEASLNVEAIVGDTLYLKSGSEAVLDMLKITDSSGNTMCEINSFYITGFNSTILLLTFDSDKSNLTYTFDTSINKRHALFSPNAHLKSENCINNECMLFNKSNSDTLTFPLGNPILTKTHTKSFWIKFDSFNPIYNMIFNEDRYFSLRSDTQSLRFSYLEGDIELPTTINKLNLWYNIIIIINDNTISYYLNGNFICRRSLSPNYNANKLLTRISGFAGTNYLNGSMDEVAIYSKALTDSEVKALYKAKRALHYEQILPKGIKEIDVSNCNLEKGQYYTVVGFTDKTKVEQVMMAK